MSAGAYRLLIGGKLVKGETSAEVIDPATAKILAMAPRASAAQVESAVAAAARAFRGWSTRSHEEREAAQRALADALERHAEEFARLLTQEQGKPLAESSGEVAGAVAGLRAFGAMRPEMKVLRQSAREKILETRKPLGVVAAIVPWNYPLMLMVMKIGPGLVTGNTFVVKPAPTTPLATLKFGELAKEILPPGVLNVVSMDDELAAALAAHPQVVKVSLTGSTATGRKVMAGVAGTLKRLTLELGGNDAAIVLDDADIKTVAPQIYASAMSNAGQICTATKRVYAPASLYRPLCDELARIAGTAVVGNGLEAGVTMGPVQNRKQFDRVRALINEARDEGTVIASGRVADEDGYYIRPTIVVNIPDTARLVREEQFGPVLPVLEYDDLADAIARVNGTEYGLAGSVWTSNVQRGLEVAAEIDAGTVWVNKFLEVPFDIPFRGSKQSGLGGENGDEAMAAYTQAKIINTAL